MKNQPYSSISVLIGLMGYLVSLNAFDLGSLMINQNTRYVAAFMALPFLISVLPILFIQVPPWFRKVHPIAVAVIVVGGGMLFKIMSKPGYGIGDVLLPLALIALAGLLAVSTFIVSAVSNGSKTKVSV